MTTRAVTYARVSGDDRGKEGRNLEGQLEMCREYAERHGYEIVAELAEDDRGASGAEIDLPQLTRLRDMAAAERFDVLVVREIDRLSRNLAKQLIVEQELERAGVKVEYVIGEYPDTAEGRLNKHIKATIAEYEREKIAERMTRGRYNKVKNGKVHLHGNSRPPYGYRASENGDNLVPHEPEAKIIRQMYRWYTEGEKPGKPLSMREIARRLSELRVPTWGDIHGATRKDAGFAQWRSSTIAGMLKKETYAGWWHYGDYKVEVPALVDRDTWEAAQRQLDKNKQRSRRNTKYDYLMQFRAYHDCGYKMGCTSKKYQSGNRYLYYVCSGNSTLPSGMCKMRQFRADHVDAAIWEWLRGWLADPDRLRDRLREYQNEQAELNKPLTERIAVADELIEEHQEQLERLLDLYLSGDFDKKMLLGRKQELEDTIKKLKAERDDLAESLGQSSLTEAQIGTIEELTRAFSEGLAAADEDFDKRRQLVELLDVTVTLTVEDGEKVAYPRFMLAEADEALVLSEQPYRYGQKMRTGPP
jgi:site-specific DNA recombinase